jgi:superfamily I DNA/RNA helicase
MPDLNPRQEAAVTYVDGPLLVLAGAGSGKIRIITRKIAHLIGARIHEPRHITAVTFTNKAAREMKERVAKLLRRDDSRGLTVSTFHTLGLDILRREHGLLGYRARHSLTLTLAGHRRRYGELTPCQPSRFLEELPQEDLLWIGGESEQAREESRKRGAQHLAGLRNLLG